LIQLEYIPPFYHKYLSKIEDEDILTLLKHNHIETAEFFERIPGSKQEFSYRPGKWTIKQILLHLIDVERIFVYRAFRFSRNDPTDLPGFDQDTYIHQAKLDHVAYDFLLKQWDTLRRSSVSFYEMLPPEALKRTGRAMGMEFTPESICYILVGHTRHHISIIKERYL
jgi:hypothetical protein